jgi:hypothetical protein
MILGVNLGYHSKKLYPLINDQYDKNSESDFVFPPQKSEYFFSATLGIRIFV